MAQISTAVRVEILGSNRIHIGYDIDILTDSCSRGNRRGNHLLCRSGEEATTIVVEAACARVAFADEALSQLVVAVQEQLAQVVLLVKHDLILFRFAVCLLRLPDGV